MAQLHLSQLGARGVAELSCPSHHVKMGEAPDVQVRIGVCGAQVLHGVFPEAEEEMTSQNWLYSGADR